MWIPDQPMSIFWLADQDTFELLRYLLPYVIVILIGGLTFVKKIFDAYVKKERERAKSEGREVRTPYASIRDFLESLETAAGSTGAKKPDRKAAGPEKRRTFAPQPSSTSWGRETAPARPAMVPEVPSRSVVPAPATRRPVRGRSLPTPAQGQAASDDDAYALKEKTGSRPRRFRRARSRRDMVVLSEIYGSPLALRPQAGSLRDSSGPAVLGQSERKN